MDLKKKIVTFLKRKKLKLAIAESCTGGMLSSAITSVVVHLKYLQWVWSPTLIKLK